VAPRHNSGTMIAGLVKIAHCGLMIRNAPEIGS
jgi:hypothetical protein